MRSKQHPKRTSRQPQSCAFKPHAGVLVRCAQADEPRSQVDKTAGIEHSRTVDGRDADLSQQRGIEVACRQA